MNVDVLIDSIVRQTALLLDLVRELKLQGLALTKRTPALSISFGWRCTAVERAVQMISPRSCRSSRPVGVFAYVGQTVERGSEVDA